MPNEKIVTVTLVLTDQQAWDCAQFLKRAGYGDYRNNAESREEAYRMLFAAEKVRGFFAEAGYAPR